MGIKLSGGDLKPTPVVGIKVKEGGKFVGTLQDKGRQVKAGRFNYTVYGFKVLDTDMPIQIKKDDEYVDTDVAEGDLVSIFAPTVLDRALQKAEVGMKIQIIYLGKKRGSKGADFHAFDVEAL